MKPSILLLHGAIGSKKQLVPLSEQLKANFNVHLLDFSGHGGKTIPEKFSIELFVDDLKHYLAEHKLKEAFVFAYSMGGFVALKFMELHPDFPMKLMTLGTKWMWTPEIATKEIQMIQPAKIKEKLPAFASYQNLLHMPQSWEEVMLKTQELMFDLGAKPQFETPRLDKIEQAVLMLRGDQDQMVTKEETLEMVSKLGNAKYLELKQTTHPIEKVDIEMIENEIVNFFSL